MIDQQCATSLKNRMRATSLYEWRQRYLGRKSGPTIVRKHGELATDGADTTFVVICGAEFDERKPNAGTTMRKGWCRGFEQLGIPYALVSIFELRRELPRLNNPVCWLAGSDYCYLDKASLRYLSQFRHAVLVSTAFQGEDTYFADHRLPSQSWHKRLRSKILSSEPDFLFTISPEESFGFYEEWMRSGIPLVSLPLACDTHLYCKPKSHDFDGVDIAFVGGYWPYKALQFDQYLKPFAERLHVYGYTAWPYGRFGGQLPEDLEGSLYASARVCPIINEPHVSLMSVDINERVFKVLGSGGLAITDATPGYRSWFSADELLVPDTLSDYIDFMRSIVTNQRLFEETRIRGQRAVLERHTYRHRALKFCETLGIEIPET